MITGNKIIIDNVIDFSEINITFSSKPLVFGGLAMEYYGLRKGRDIDLFISNEDYQVLVKKYPKNKKDIWGDLGLVIGKYDFLRSVFRLDYDFYSDGSFEYETYKVMSFEKLFFMKAIAYNNNPGIQKYSDDFKLMIDYYIETFRNKDYYENALKHVEKYLSVQDGIILNDDY